MSTVAAATAFRCRAVRFGRLNRAQKAVAAATALKGASHKPTRDVDANSRLLPLLADTATMAEINFSPPGFANDKRSLILPAPSGFSDLFAIQAAYPLTSQAAGRIPGHDREVGM